MKTFISCIFFLLIFAISSFGEQFPNSMVTYHSETYTFSSPVLSIMQGHFTSDNSISTLVQYENGFLSIIRGLLAGSHQETFIKPAGMDSINSVAMNDINGDGLDDLVLSGKSSNELRNILMISKGDGTFEEHDYILPGSRTLIPDVTSDGRADLFQVIITPDSTIIPQHPYVKPQRYEVFIWPGNGDGTFGDPVVSPCPGGLEFYFNAVSDLNEDGKPDLILRVFAGADEYGPLYKSAAAGWWYDTVILYGYGNGTFNKNTRIQDFIFIKKTDINNDTIPDLLGRCGDYFVYELNIYIGNETGSFIFYWKTETGYGSNKQRIDTRYVNLADISGNGFPDVGVLYLNGSKLSMIYYLNNGDGTLSAPVTVVDSLPADTADISYTYGTAIFDTVDAPRMHVRDSRPTDSFQFYVLDSEVGINNKIQQLPIVLSGNAPNPFNMSTSISWSLSEGMFVRLEIYDIIGRKVKTLVNDDFYNTGTYTTPWSGEDDTMQPVSDGIYFAVLTAPDRHISASHKILLLK